VHDVALQSLPGGCCLSCYCHIMLL
jgi:hypothetical protein